MTDPILFPLWQVDRGEYNVICRYLGLQPDSRLYDEISKYLEVAPFRFRPPVGFAHYLAKPRLTRMRVGMLDLVTKLLFPEHPLRHALNAVMAIHECDPAGFRQMALAPTGPLAFVNITGWMVGFAGKSLAAIPWAAWQFLLYSIARPFRSAHNDLRGYRVLITGVNRGLGQQLMLVCLERGAEIIGTVRSDTSLNAVHSMLPATSPVRLIIADLSLPGDLVDALMAQNVDAAGIDIAILCAGVKHDGESVLALDGLRHTFEVNFFSAAEFADWLYHVSGADTQEAAPCAALALGGQPRGCRNAGFNRPPTNHGKNRRIFVLVSSIGRWHGMHFTAGYNASKAALSVWGESLEMELRLSGHPRRCVTIVEPGMFASGMTMVTGVMKLLLPSSRELADRIISGALTGKRTVRSPTWFVILTWSLCLLGRDFRYWLFSKAKAVRSSETEESSTQ